MKDYYSTLEVGRDATNEDIKKSFRRLSMKYHPDHNPEDKSAEDKFKEVNEAYSVLSNETKKREYDNPDPFGGVFSNVFRGFGQPQKPDLNAPVNGRFIGLEIELSLKAFVFGGKFRTKASYHEGCEACGGKGFNSGEECPNCRGVGVVQHVERSPGFMSTSSAPCPNCGGLGVVSTDKCKVCNGNRSVFVENKVIEFDVPAGVKFGSKIVIPSAGRAGLNGGRRGDVVVFVKGVKLPPLNKVSSDKVEQLKALLEELDSGGQGT